MLDAGWAGEVSRLIGEVPAHAPAWNATGYEIVRRHVLGELDRRTTLDRVVIETRQYAKRQRTWFARDAGDPLPWPIDSAALAVTAERFFSK